MARESVEWTDDGTARSTVPASVPGTNVDAFPVADHVKTPERRLRELRAERWAYLAEFAELDDEIAGAVY